MKDEFVFACPVCQGALTAVSEHAQRCDLDNIVFLQRDGIWRFLVPGAYDDYAQFIQEYETIRQKEGRSSDNPTYYRALPFFDYSGHRTEEWQIRARSFMTLLHKVILPMEALSTRQPSALKIVDLGAGNGWMSNHLAERGHALAAIDLTINAFDGLGAHKMYETAFTCIQAEFDNLPLMENQFDLVIFNASFHYAVEYATTLTSAWRVLRSGGKVAIVDTAVYHNPASGQQMVREREALFQRTYGFASNALASENYLTYHRLAELAEQLDISWQFIWPIPRWRWTLRRWRTALRGQREPGQLPIIIGKKRD